MTRMSIVTVTYFMCGLMEVGCGAMRGMGSSFIPMMISFVGSCALRIVWIFTVFRTYPTMNVLYFAYPLSWATTATVFHRRCRYAAPQKKEGRHISKNHDQRPPQSGLPELNGRINYAFLCQVRNKT